MTRQIDVTINVSGISGWWLVKAGLFFAFVSTILTIATSQWAASEPLLASAAAVDLIFAIPVAYFILIRRSSIPKVTVLPVFFASVTAAYFLIPQIGQGVVSAVVNYALPAVEIVALGYIVLRLGRIVRAYRQTNDEGLDVIERLRSAFERELKPPFVARAASFELGVFIFAFIKWRRPKPPSANFETFAYHRANGSVQLLAVLLFLLAAETIIVHILLAMWSPTAAWVVTALSIYFAIQVFAHLNALLLRPILVTENELLLRCGILGDAMIRLDHIYSADKAVSQTDDKIPSAILTPLGQMSQPNVTIHLSTETKLNGIYGIAKPIKTVSFRVDEPERFIAAVRNAISDL